MGWDVMNRRNDFTKPPDKYSELSVPSLYTFSQTSAHVFFNFSEFLEPNGPNVATAEGAKYRFHVQIAEPALS